MNGIEVVNAIRGFAAEHNCTVGICRAEPIKGLQDRLRPAPFVNRNLRRRLCPEEHLHGVKSVVVLGMPYGAEAAKGGGLDSESEACPNNGPGGGRCGIICGMAAAPDYHVVLKNVLRNLAAELQRAQPCECRAIVDGGGLVEREWAVKAGLGFWGKNCLVISPSGGSFFNIGLLLTTLELPEAKPRMAGPSGCGECQRCVKACPGHAIAAEGYAIDYTRCASYLTQKKTELTAAEQRIIGQRLYGCDTCQRACPYNSGHMAGEKRVKLDWVLGLDKPEFEKTLGQTAAGWIGLPLLQRNARIILAGGVNSSSGCE
jgi:epoxyqueuosine reductase